MEVRRGVFRSTGEPGASEVFTHEGTRNPLSTAFFASKPAATITDGFDVLVQLVIAAITTEPCEIWPLGTCFSISGPGTGLSQVAPPSPSKTPTGFSRRAPGLTSDGNASSKDFRACDSATRS